MHAGRLNKYNKPCLQCDLARSCDACVATADCAECTTTARCSSCRGVHGRARRLGFLSASLGGRGAAVGRARDAAVAEDRRDLPRDRSGLDAYLRLIAASSDGLRAGGGGRWVVRAGRCAALRGSQPSRRV